MSKTFNVQRRKATNPQREDLEKTLQTLNSSNEEHHIPLRNTCRDYLNKIAVQEILSFSTIESLIDSEEMEISKLIDMVRQLAQFYEQFDELDISEEITLLHEIKDVQDELTIMGRVFEDQRNVLETLERLVHAIERSNAEPIEGEAVDDPPHLTQGLIDSLILQPEDIPLEEPGISPEETSRLFTISTHGEETAHAKSASAANQEQVTEDTPTEAPVIEPTLPVERTADETQDKSTFQFPKMPVTKISGQTQIPDKHPDDAKKDKQLQTKQPNRQSKEYIHLNRVWRASNDSNHMSLPIHTVQHGIDEINWMIERATDTTRSVRLFPISYAYQPSSTSIVSLQIV